MSLGSVGGMAAALLKKQTPLQQLLEDVNFQRTKEMRQLLKDDSGFVMLQGTSYWTDLFVRHFLFQSEPVHSIDSDDLLFFVRKKHVKSSSRHMPKFETEVEVFRKDSRKLPIGDPDVDWEETVYLNMVVHQFDYTLTLAICTRTSPKELQVLRRHSQRVYASPSRRKMDTKGEGEEMTYPHICFMVDNFDDVFSDILVRDGEMVCVELVANDKDGSVQGVIFLGSIRYDALKKVYDARQSSLSSKVAQRMSFGLFSSGATVKTRCEFVRMKGPQGKGHAEMAVTKPKDDSGVETPTSEPGFCATDMWDEWEEENDDYCSYRHQRRLSDPSANLNNFTRYAWRTKGGNDCLSNNGGGKARSENEGLDSLANEVSEIEAGDLRDDHQRPAFSASGQKLHQNPECESYELSVIKDHSPTKEAANSDEAVNDKIIDQKSNEKQQKATKGLTQASEATNEALNAIEIVMAATPTEQMAALTLDSPTKSTSKSTGCSNCFGGKKSKRWTTKSDSSKTPEMSQVYCPTCDDDRKNESPDCLNKMPSAKIENPKLKSKNILNVDSEIIVVNHTRSSSLRLRDRKSVTRCSSLSAADQKKKQLEKEANSRKERMEAKDKLKSKTKEGSSKFTTKTSAFLAKVSPKRNRNRSNTEEKSTKPKIKAPEQNEKEKAKNIGASPKDACKRAPSKASSAPVAQIYEIADDVATLNGSELCSITDDAAKIAVLNESETKLMVSVRGKEELPVIEQTAQIVKDIHQSKGSKTTATTKTTTATTTSPVNANVSIKCIKKVPVKTECHPLQTELTNDIEDDDIVVIGEQNLTNQATANTSDTSSVNSKDFNCNHSDVHHQHHDHDHQHQHQHHHHHHASSVPSNCNNNNDSTADCKKDNEKNLNAQNDNSNGTTHRSNKRSHAAQQAFYTKALNLVPKRRTPDGTDIYYWCDLSSSAIKELDDGAYNPLWTSRGFTQSFHFWKENRRQRSTPLNAFLTYVTLPWWSIAKDLLDHREPPILTF